jgi:hypothetical protein
MISPRVPPGTSQLRLKQALAAAMDSSKPGRDGRATPDKLLAAALGYGSEGSDDCRAPPRHQLSVGDYDKVLLTRLLGRCEACATGQSASGSAGECQRPRSAGEAVDGAMQTS